MADRKIVKIAAKILLAGIGLIIVGALVAFIFRKNILDYAVAKAARKLKHDYGLTLRISQKELSGIKSVNLGKVSISQVGDTVLKAKDLEVGVKLWPLFFGQVAIGSVGAGAIEIDGNAARKIKKLNAPKGKEPNADTTLPGKLNKLITNFKRISGNLPDYLDIKTVLVKYRDTFNQYYISARKLEYDDGDLRAGLVFVRNDEVVRWQVSGVFNHETLEADIDCKSNRLVNLNPGTIEKIRHTILGVRSVNLKLEKIASDNKRVQIGGSLSADSFLVRDERFSPDSIIVRKGGIKFTVQADGTSITLKEPSRVYLDKVGAEITGRFDYKTPRFIELSCRMPLVSAQDFINALPYGTFTQFNGMQIQGMLEYSLDFALNITEKDSVRIVSDLNGKNLKITRYGEADLSKLNGSFLYHPFNSDRQFIVGEENPNYVKLTQISPYLPRAIMTMEDPHFYTHKGFEEEAFEAAFLDNLQKGAFKKSGSTLTQQLVKNVFLTHKKTIDRKVEEMLMVWLIENLGIVSKQRMLEMYMNLIEWGPGIYGVKEACRYYFNKSPDSLSLGEAIFLAHIIRSPKKFMYHFNGQGELSDYALRLERRTAFYMYRNRLIDENAYNTYWGDVHITGPAKSRIRLTPPDSTMLRDSLDIRDDDW